MLRCTPGHIPRYMGQTSNNNDKMPAVIPVMTPVMIPVMMLVMIPVMNPVIPVMTPDIPVMITIWFATLILHAWITAI